MKEKVKTHYLNFTVSVFNLSGISSNPDYLKKQINERNSVQFSVKQKEELSKTDLIFLYEIDEKIDGFGYEKDPRISELRNNRKDRLEEDVFIIFECTKDQIAKTPNDINENTKVYISFNYFVHNCKLQLCTKFNSKL